MVSSDGWCRSDSSFVFVVCVCGKKSGNLKHLWNQDPTLFCAVHAGVIIYTEKYNVVSCFKEAVHYLPKENLLDCSQSCLHGREWTFQRTFWPPKFACMHYAEGSLQLQRPVSGRLKETGASCSARPGSPSEQNERFRTVHSSVGWTIADRGEKAKSGWVISMQSNGGSSLDAAQRDSSM